jgi:membrane-associated phospholipid phosphatase
MERLWSTGIAIVLRLQELGTGLTGLMKALSFLGDVEFYLLVMPALYWCWDAGMGLRTGILLMLSGGLNEALKVALHQPRPYWIGTAVQALSDETTFGLPSGHAQHAVVVWGWLAHGARRAWVWSMAAVLTALICISRAYLGMHFPHSLLIGAMVGAVLLWAFVRWEPRASDWLTKRSLREQLSLSLAASLAMLGLTGLATASLRGWAVPSTWAEAVLSKTGESMEALVPDNAIMIAGVLFGLGAGAAWLKHRGGFSAAGTAPQRLLRYLLGMIVVAALWFGLGSALPQDTGPVSLLLRYVNASLVGFWVARGAPVVFGRLGLASLSEDTATASRSG